MGPIEAKRVVLTNLAIPAETAADFDNPLQVDLLVAQETVDEELESDGTNIAQVRPYSKVVGMKLNLVTHGWTAGTIVRWMLVKDTDNEIAPTSLADANFHSSNDSPTLRELRAMTLAKGFFVASDKTASKVNIFVKRKTLKRLGNMREQDRLTLCIAQSSTDNGKITGFGTLYVRMN